MVELIQTTTTGADARYADDTPDERTPGGPGGTTIRTARLPNLDGEVDTLLASDPGFRLARRGYDRLQVNTYVDHVGTELATARAAWRAALDAQADIAMQLGLCRAEVSRLTGRLTASAQDADPARLSDRVREILRLAAAEAAEHRAAKEAEAERLLAQTRSAATQALEQARAEAARITDAAAAERNRLHREAQAAREQSDRLAAQQRARAEAQARQTRADAQAAVAAAQQQTHSLDAEREAIEAALRRVHERLGIALSAMQQPLSAVIPGIEEASTRQPVPPDPSGRELPASARSPTMHPPVSAGVDAAVSKHFAIGRGEKV